MNSLSRREFTGGLITSLLTSSLLEVLFRCDVFATSIKPITDRWLKDVYHLCRDLRGSKIELVVWQRKMEQLFSQIELSELLRFIDFDRLTKSIEFPDLGVITKDVRFPRLKGLPHNLNFIGRIFAMSKGRAIIPHGHRNMVSGHLIIKGEMHVRHFERIEDQGDYMIISPTIDRHSIAGESTTISSKKDNIHWLIAESDSAFTFDVIVVGLNPDMETYQDFIDPDRGEKLEEARMRVKRISVGEGLERYGKS